MKGPVGDEVMEAPTVSVGTVGINSKHCHGGNLASYEEEEEYLASIVQLCVGFHNFDANGVSQCYMNTYLNV